MSEKDLELKAKSRRLSWVRGYATRVDVPLRVYVDKSRNPSGFEESTDLDVVAVDISKEGKVRIGIFDCKTSPKRSTERAFWLRGVADYVDADNAWMVRESKVSEAARQLASSLDLGVLTSEDLRVLASIDQYEPVPKHEAYNRLFSAESMALHRQRMGDLPSGLKRLDQFLRYDFWAVDNPARNLSLTVSALRTAADELDVNNPIHVAVLFDAAWMYLLSLARASDYIRCTNASDLQLGLAEYFLGGQHGIRDKEKARNALRRIDEHSGQSSLPDYFNMLLELFARFYVLPGHFIGSMRYSEVLAASLCARKRSTIKDVSGEEYDLVCAKLLNDCVRFLVKACNLRRDFLEVSTYLTLAGNG